MKPQKGDKQAEKTSAIKVGKDSGRVKVFVRVRPPRPQENSRKEPIAVNVQELSSQIHVTDPKHSWEKTFNFDHVFPKESTNPEVCSTISRPLVNAALNGFNGTLMAYGQTGSGKTHTLMAPDGITAGVIERCFKRITQDDYHDYKVTMSYLQIYQEKIYDLLNSTNKVELSLREHPVKGVYVENLSEFVVRSPSEVLNLLAVGKKRLVFAETKMNRNSSRSHSVCQLTIERTLNKNKILIEGASKHAANVRESKDGLVASSGKSSEQGSEDDSEAEVAEENGDTEDDSFTKMVAFNDDVLIRGRIYLCDLAGSERLKKTHAEGERLSEAQHINSSLLELGNVIQALAEGKKTHVPFRNSTLTRLLQESLGGNCKTSLVVCVSPTMGDVSETKSALFFGSRAMKITNTAYVNVEVDYKRLSEDLSKIVDMREKDLEELKQSYENRIERLKHEAETTVANAMTETDKVVASVKSLFENEQSSLQSDVENLNSRLEEEMSRTANLQGEMTVTKCKLDQDMFRARSTLLMDIISMQLFYALKDLSLDDALDLPENEIKFKDGPTQWTAARSKVLENADLLLETFKSYLNVMNSRGEQLLDNCGSLMSLIGSEELLDDRTLLRDTEDVSLYLTNKTDDDKVVASSRCNETLLESRNEDLITDTEEKLCDSDGCSNLRDKLISLKNCIDGEALSFLKKAFELDLENEDKITDSRQGIYKRIQEFMEQRNSVLDSQKNPELPPVADGLTLLDHCHSHVIIDKALQSALLVLENDNITKHCHDIQKQKNVLEDENETLRKQIHCLQQEAEKLNGKLTETSTTLCDVKKSKERLEYDLSSVFQLHNMKYSERIVEKEDDELIDSTLPEKLQENITTLVENNAELQEKLEATEQDRENLKSELTSVKQELQREREKNLRLQQHTKSAQTEKIQQDGSANPPMANHSLKSQDREILQGLLSSLHDDYSSSLEKAAYAAQTNDLDEISSLRTVINQRLGEEWSLVVLENAKMKSELDNIRGRIDEEKRSFESELANSKLKEANGGETSADEDVFVDETMFLENEMANHMNDQRVLEIMIYDQKKVIAKLEVDKLELTKGLQRYRADPNKNLDVTDGNIESTIEMQQNGWLTKDDLGTIVQEQFHKLSTVQQENESLKSELDSLRSKYSFLEKENDDSNKLREILEKNLKTHEEGEKTLAISIAEMREKCSKIEENLALSSTENNELKEKLLEVEHKLFTTQQARDAITKQKIALEESIREQQDNIERELASEREQKMTLEEKLLAKTQEFEEGKNLLKLKENCLSKVETELAETKANYEKLIQERLNQYELEKGSMLKEINSLRCLQGLPTLNLALNKESVTQKQEVRGGLKSGERAQNKKNNKLNSELTRAKEQLVRLKAELTMSNMQTRNLGTQLSSLREDSTKLEAELSTVRISPRNSRQRRNSFSYYDETVRLEIELAEAKEKIIDLQEKLLCIYKEKFVLEEKITNLERERHADIQNGEKPFSLQYDQEHGFDLEQTKELEKKIDSLKAEKAQLKKDLESTNADRSRLEGIELCVQQLVSLEDEQLRLKSRLKKWAQNAADEQQMNETTTNASKMVENNYLNDLRELSAENCALQEETNHLKETIAELESDLAALKLKMSIKDITQEATADKKAVASLLVSVKQERAELQKALDDVLIEKGDLEEELSGIKMKHARLQREFAMTSMIKDDLELEVLSLKKANLTRGLSNLTQSSEECKSEMSDCSIDELMAFGDNVVDVSAGKKIVSPGGGKKRTNGVNNRKTATARNHREGQSSSSGRKNSSSENEKKASPAKKSNLQSLQLSPKKTNGRRALPSSPGRGTLGTSTPRFITDDNQSTNDNPQHPAVSYDLIRIDDVSDEALHGDTDYRTDSGLLRETPQGERENPEGMEHDVTNARFDTDDITAHFDKEDKSEIFLDNTTVELNDDLSSTEDTSEMDSTVTQPAEVLVKTAWSIKNIFRRQKSLPLPDHKLGALKQ